MVLRWNTILVLVILVCQIVLGAPNLRRAKRDDSNVVAAENSDLNPITYEDGAIDGLDREKRKLPEATFQAKNAILGFVFGASRNVVGASLGGLSRSGVTTTQATTTTTDDTPDFNRSKVQLDITDDLFASTFPLITSVSQTIGDFMMGTARRTAEFVWVLQPLIGKNLKVEIPTTTPKPAERRSG